MNAIENALKFKVGTDFVRSSRQLSVLLRSHLDKEDTVLGLIAADTGQPIERIFEDSRHDHWYTAGEAREYGFIDAVADSFAQVMPARKRPFGLKAGSAQ